MKKEKSSQLVIAILVISKIESRIFTEIKSKTFQAIRPDLLGQLNTVSSNSSSLQLPFFQSVH